MIDRDATLEEAMVEAKRKTRHGIIGASSARQTCTSQKGP
jgi:hypothetical protein